MKNLTKEQAIVISGYTGVMYDVDGLVEDASKRLGRKLSVTDLPAVRDELKDEYFDEFIDLFPINHTDKQ